jgi:heme/copper-type cytochrome/quinol oxidase subunit 4
LSGFLPDSLRGEELGNQVGSVDLLEGNMFNCHSYSDLPSDDPHVGSFHCGPAELNVALYSVLAVTVFGAAVGCLVYVYSKLGRDGIADALASPQLFADIAHHDHYAYYACGVRNLRNWSIKYAAVIAGVLIPVYLALKSGPSQTDSGNDGYKTHAGQYTWLPSAAMLSGPLPAAVLLTVWLLLVCAPIYYLPLTSGSGSSGGGAVGRNRNDSTSSSERDTDTETERSVSVAVSDAHARFPSAGTDSTAGGVDFNSNSSATRNKKILSILAFVVSTIVTIGITVLYVYIVVSSDLSRDTESMLAVAFALFQLFWSGVILTFCAHDELHNMDCSMKLYCSFGVFILTEVLVPVFAVMVTDPSCMENILYPPPSIGSSYKVPVCVFQLITAGGDICLAYDYESIFTSYDPPFICK